MDFINRNLGKLRLVAAVVFLLLFIYSCVGTSGNVNYIKDTVNIEIANRGWRILRYEGFSYGSFRKHGGVCWYHVRDISDESIQYRVQVSSWGGELQYWYGEPETLKRIKINANIKGE